MASSRFRPFLHVSCFSLLLVAAVALVSGANANAGGGEDWASLGMRLSGESAASYEKVVARLRKIPRLESRLRSELAGERRHLAMDVISALQLRSLLPDLMQVSATDHTGLSYNAINALLTKANEKNIARLYESRLFFGDAPPAARVVMWDTLGRLGTPVDGVKARRALTGDPSPDVRSAVLYYARLMVLRRERKAALPLIGAALHAEPFQLRVQALFLISELTPLYRSSIAADPTACTRDPEPEVRSVCHALFPRGSWAP